MDARTKQVTQVTEILTDKSQATIDKVLSRPTDKSVYNHEDSDLGRFQAVQGRTVGELAKRDKLLSSGEAAVVLGLSKSEFKRRVAVGIYVASHIGTNGWHFFSPEYLATLPGYGNAQKSTPGPLKASAKVEFTGSQNLGYASEDASRIFQSLDDGMSSREIVKRLSVHPDTMKAVYEAWKQLGTMESGGIQLSAKTLEAINELPLPGTYPVTTEEQLLANLRQASKDTPLCNVCHKLPCRLCPGCAEAVYSQPEPAPAKMGRPRKTA